MSASNDTLKQALAKACEDLQLDLPLRLVIAPPKEQKFGDLATNVAMLLAPAAGRPPRELALAIADRLRACCPPIASATVAGPGFINVVFQPDLWQQVIPAVEQGGDKFGHSVAGAGRRVLVEYVSANPTGPLHVGHGRGAALGDSIARILTAAGYETDTEYYLNDAGRQMRTLGRSIWLRLQELAGREVEFPDDCYRGDYIRELAQQLLAQQPQLAHAPENAGLDICQQYGSETILAGIKADLSRFDCRHDRFASEKALVENGAVENALETLREQGHTWEEDGALWLDTMSRGDDRQRVLRKSDGFLTYLATDIAYHHDKFQRGYDWIIDIWGADHHGYIPRMKAAIAHMGHDPAQFSVVLVQLVNLLRRGEVIPMSTRAGQFETLQAVLDEVGPDAARFIFLSRSSDSPLDFDLALALERSMDNPVYYVQYAHARICALHRRAAAQGISTEEVSEAPLAGLNRPEELAILRQLDQFPDVVAESATNLAPHHIARYLQALAKDVHGYYAKYKVLDQADASGSTARLRFLRAVAQVIKNGLHLLGVSAPEVM